MSETKRKRISTLRPGDHIWWEGDIHLVTDVERDDQGNWYVSHTYVDVRYRDDEPDNDMLSDVEWPVASAEEALEAAELSKPSFVQRCIDIVVAGNPTCDKVKPLVSEFYAMPNNGAGGNLHNVLDDCNIEDSAVDWCVAHSIEMGDPFGKWLGRVLRLMSKTQRNKLASSKTTARLS